jgi:hypothetical protein
MGWKGLRMTQDLPEVKKPKSSVAKKIAKFFMGAAIIFIGVPYLLFVFGFIPHKYAALWELRAYLIKDDRTCQFVADTSMRKAENVGVDTYRDGKHMIDHVTCHSGAIMIAMRLPNKTTWTTPAEREMDRKFHDLMLTIFR